MGDAPALIGAIAAGIGTIVTAVAALVATRSNRLKRDVDDSAARVESVMRERDSRDATIAYKRLVIAARDEEITALRLCISHNRRIMADNNITSEAPPEPPPEPVRPSSAVGVR